MKLKCRSRYNRTGDGLVVLIVFLALIGVGIWWLYSHRNAMDKEGRQFGRDMIESLAVKHDKAFFADHLSPQAKVDYPPSVQQTTIEAFQQMGVPAQPIKIEENMQWKNQFFEPQGFFTARLNYPARGATIRIAVSHPVSKWQLDNLEFAPDRGQ